MFRLNLNYEFRKFIYFLLFVFLVSGCAVITPKPQPLINRNAASVTQSAIELSQLLKSYNSSMDQKNYDDARVPRDRMIELIRTDIDLLYVDVETQLYEKRAEFNTLADFAELGLAGAGAITNGERAKTILATILGVGKGTRLSYDKNWYGEKATASLINTMRAGRDSKWVDILKKMTANNAGRYPFEEAQADLIGYYQSGSIYSALVDLAAATGKTATDKANAVIEANTPRYPVLAKATLDTVAENNKLREQGLKMTTTQSRVVLEHLNITIPADATDSSIKDLLLDQVAKLITAGPAERKKIVDAFNTNSP